MIDNIELGKRIVFDENEPVYYDGLFLNGLVGTIINTGGYSITICFDRNDLRTDDDGLHNDKLYNALMNGYVNESDLIDYSGDIDEQTRCWNIAQDLVEKYASLLVDNKDGIVYD